MVRKMKVHRYFVEGVGSCMQFIVGGQAARDNGCEGEHLIEEGFDDLVRHCRSWFREDLTHEEVAAVVGREPSGTSKVVAKALWDSFYEGK